MEQPFAESKSQEYIDLMGQTANLFAYISAALKVYDSSEQMLRMFMPHPLKSSRQVDLVCSRFPTGELLHSDHLVCCYRHLAVVQKQATSFPVLERFLANRDIVARYFLALPLLLSLAEAMSHEWKLHRGYKEHQSWVYLEHTEQRVRDWIRDHLPRSCKLYVSHQVARFLDDIDRKARVSGISKGGRYTLDDAKSDGLFNDEWVSHYPLALVALDLIKSEAALKVKPRISLEHPQELLCVDFEAGGEYIGTLYIENCLKPFKVLMERHGLRFASIRLIGMKLLHYYSETGDLHPEDIRAVHPFQNGDHVRKLLLMLDLSVDAKYEWLLEDIEDLLEDACALLKSNQVCDCCASSFQAIVDCSSAYAVPLTKVRLPQLAKDVLLNWKKPEMNKLWIDTQAPFPGFILDEIERYERLALQPPVMTEKPPSLDHIVGQYRKAKIYGLVREHKYKDPVMQTVVQVLEMAEAQAGR